MIRHQSFTVVRFPATGAQAWSRRPSILLPHLGVMLPRFLCIGRFTFYWFTTNVLCDLFEPLWLIGSSDLIPTMLIPGTVPSGPCS